MPQERLQKIIAAAGIASRRKAEELITSGHVTVNGNVVTELGSKGDPDSDDIRVDGKSLRAEQTVYIVLHKPKGYVTTVSDPEGRPTVLDLVKNVPQRVFPVGRLDYLSEGLLLLTNDGELAARLTHASTHVPKRYLVKVSGQPQEHDVQRLREGVVLPAEQGHVHAPADEGGKFAGQKRRSTAVSTAPAKIVLIREGDNPWYEVTLVEGRNRQIRRMFSFIGHHVEKIKRVSYGPLELDVDTGQWRLLTLAEVARLQSASTGHHEAPPADKKQDERRISPNKPKRSSAPSRGGERARYGKASGERRAYSGSKSQGERRPRRESQDAADRPVRASFDGRAPGDRPKFRSEAGRPPRRESRGSGADRGFSKPGQRRSFDRPDRPPFKPERGRPFDKDRRRSGEGERPAYAGRTGERREGGEGRPQRAGGFDRKPGYGTRGPREERGDRPRKFDGPRGESRPPREDRPQRAGGFDRKPGYADRGPREGRGPRGGFEGARKERSERPGGYGRPKTGGFGPKRDNRGFAGRKPFGRPFPPKRRDEENPREESRGPKRSDDFVNEVARRYADKLTAGRSQRPGKPFRGGSPKPPKDRRP